MDRAFCPRCLVERREGKDDPAAAAAAGAGAGAGGGAVLALVRAARSARRLVKVRRLLEPGEGDRSCSAVPAEGGAPPNAWEKARVLLDSGLHTGLWGGRRGGVLGGTAAASCPATDSE